MKKILIITNNAFSKTSNNGKTYEAMFSSFEREQLAQIFFRPQLNIDFDFCSNFYMVTEIDIINKILLRTNTCGKEINNEEKDKVINQSKVYTNKRNGLKNNPIIRDYIWKTRLWKNQGLKDWCNKVNPDLVFFIGANQSFTYDIANYISDYLNIPMILYYTDDYLINPIYTSIAGKIQKWRIKSYYRKAIKKAKIRFCIGEEMAKAYTEYFGVHFYHIMNSVDIIKYSTPNINTSKIKIGYFGGLHLGRWKMIARLASATPANTEVHVYTFTPIVDEIKTTFEENGVIYHNGIQGKELRDAMSQCQILLHVESDDKFYRSLTKLSVSTKIPEYLMHGRMIIGYGPSEVASLKLLSNNKLGIVLSSEDSDETIKDKLEQTLNNKPLILEYSIKGYEYALKNYNKQIIATDFKNKIINVINNN